MVLGGGSTLSPHYVVTPLEGLRAAFPDAEIDLVRGCVNFKHLPIISARQCRVPDSDRAGLRVSFYNGEDCVGEPVLVTHPRQGQLLWFGGVGDAVEEQFCARIESQFVPEESGPHRVSLMSGRRASRSTGASSSTTGMRRRAATLFGSGSSEVIGVADLTVGQPVRLEVTFRRVPSPMGSGVRIGLAPPSLVDDLEGAERAAAAADVAIVVVGLTGEWESEGHDRADLELPGAQRR
jgi:beta-glucosidase